MLDPWLLIAIIITPFVLGIIILTAKVNCLRKLTESCGDSLYKWMLKPLNQRLIQPLEERSREKKQKQREIDFADWQAQQSAEALKREGTRRP